MKKLRRIAALFAIVLLGAIAWFAVLLCSRVEHDLQLSRELSSGRLIAKLPAPKPPFFKIFTFDAPLLSAKYSQPSLNISGALPQILMSPAAPGTTNERWYITLDPLDKSWELEITETRAVRLRFGDRSWRIGSHTRLWRTKRTQNSNAEFATNPPAKHHSI